MLDSPHAFKFIIVIIFRTKIHYASRTTVYVHPAPTQYPLRCLSALTDDGDDDDDDDDDNNNVNKTKF
jgi:hypothetical protein